MENKNKMLIDATHPEETRVVAVRNGRVEEFDFESAARKLLRGNIYLAKVTRVEPSLQAAFIDYGGNRHGFLAFSEIHPDYYQIPVADRELLKQEEAEAELRAEAEVEERVRSRSPRRRRKGRGDRSGGGTDHQARNAARDEQDRPDDIETFEDGYRTSGPSDDDDEGGQPTAPQAYRHASSDENRLRDDDAPRHEEGPASDPMVGVPVPAPDNDTASSSAIEDHAGAVTPAAPAQPSGPRPPPIAYPRGTGRPVGQGDVARPHVTIYAPDEAPVDDMEDDDETDEGPDAENGVADDESVEQVANDDDVLEEVPERPRRRARQYKIQEVIKRRQIILVQVVKEERGNKGAALTTYISLAGRYTVLMPNTARGGGISRKITQPQDRKRLKSIAEELDVEEGMGLIIRTAGAARTKQEIKRDYDYLIRLWESVRDLTLSSIAPCLVYEEGNIIKRAIRDLYSKDFDQIVVAGDSAHRGAQDFMEMLMPGSGSHVVNYRAPEPLFARYGVERQLNALFSPYVTLRSGGYIVINQTEALVSVDVNSGKSTREFSIEETALNTNLEASEEIARQLKLRDLAGLIVVDFIDMEEKRNNRSVERRLKDALRHDRARIQVGRISHFGLLEMSRQRLRAGVLEGSTSQCPHCQGTGIIRSIESVALAVLRGLEDQLLKQPSSLIATTTAEVALYILNHKRAYITEMERRHGVIIRVEASDRMQGANFGVERIATPALAKPAARAAVSMEWGFDRDDSAVDDAEEADAESPGDELPEAGESTQAGNQSNSDEEPRGRRRRRRRGRRDAETHDRSRSEVAGRELENASASDDDHGDQPPPSHDDAHDDALAGEDGAETKETTGSSEDGPADEAGGEARRRGRRRGRRGGRSRRREGDAPAEPVATADGIDRHEWGIAEYARPGAEQPSSFADDSQDAPALHLVSSVEIETRTTRSRRSTRASIVESADARSEATSFDFSTAEAVRLAVTLAGGSPEAPSTPIGHASTSREGAIEQSSPGFVDEPASVTGEPAATSARSPEPSVTEPSVAETPRADPPIPVATEARDMVDVTQPSVRESEVANETADEQHARQAAASSSAGDDTEHGETAQVAAPRSNGHAEHHVEPQSAHAGEHVERDHATAASESEPPPPARRGWWQRRFGDAE